MYSNSKFRPEKDRKVIEMLSNPNKRTVPANFVIPKKPRRSEQPSYTNVEELLQPVNVNDNRFHMEVGRHFLENLSDSGLKNHLRFTEAKRVVNNDLYKKFLIRQQKLTRLDRPHDISYGFLLLDGDASELEFICSRGYAAGYSFCGDLGNPRHGVYLSRFSDLCTPAPFFAGISLRILIFKMLPGRSKPVGLSSFTIPADPYCDSHIPRMPQHIRSLARHDQFRFSQIFLYEHDDRGELVDFPTGVYPFAYVTVNISPPEPQLVVLRQRLERDSIVWTGLLSFKNETLDRVEMVATNSDNVMKPRGLESKIEIQMLISWNDCLNYNPVSKLLASDNAGKLVRSPEYIVQDKNGLLQCASYFTIVQNNSPLFFRVHHAMRNEHLAGIAYMNGTLLILIPNGEFSSLLSLPRHDKPVFHCIFLSYQSFITSSTNLEVDNMEEETFKHVPFKGEKVDGHSEPFYTKMENAQKAYNRYQQQPTHLGTTNLAQNRIPHPPPIGFPFPPPPMMNVPPPGYMPVVTTTSGLPMVIPPPPPPAVPPKKIEVESVSRAESASPPTVEMPDASPRAISISPEPIEEPIPIQEPKTSKEASPSDGNGNGEPKTNYLQQAMMGIKQMEEKKASESPKEDFTELFKERSLADTTSTAKERSKTKPMPSMNALRDPRVRKLYANDTSFLEKIVSITGAVKKSESPKEPEPSGSNLPLPLPKAKTEEEEIERPYSPSDAILDTSDEFTFGKRATSSTTTDEASKISQLTVKDELPAYVSSSTSSASTYVPPSGRSILGSKATQAKPENLGIPADLIGLISQPISENVDFNFSGWKPPETSKARGRRDSGPMSPLALQIVENDDVDESVGEPTVSSTTHVPDTTRTDEISEPLEPDSPEKHVLTKEPKMIPLHSTEEVSSPTVIGETWRKPTVTSNDADMRIPFSQTPPSQISPSSTTNFVLPNFSVPPPVIPTPKAPLIPTLLDLTRPPPSIDLTKPPPTFAGRPPMHIPPPPQMFGNVKPSSGMARPPFKTTEHPPTSIARPPFKTTDQPTSSFSERRSSGSGPQKSSEVQPRRGQSRFDKPPSGEKVSPRTMFVRDPRHQAPQSSAMPSPTGQQTSNEKKGLVRNMTILVDPQLIIQGNLDINEFQKILEAMRGVNVTDKSFNWHMKYHRHIEERLANIDDRYADLIMEFEQNGVIQRMAPHFCDESKVKNPYSGAMICAMTVKRAAAKDNPAARVVFMTVLDPNSEEGNRFTKNEIELETPQQVSEYCIRMAESVKK